MELRRQIATIRAWLPLLVASVLLAAGAAFVVSGQLPKTYEAKATLIVGQALSAANPDYTQLLVSQRLSTTYATVATKRPILDSVIKQLGLDDIDPETITSDTYLFGEGQGLELDSVDAIEIEVLVKTEYGIEILASERNRTTFGTFGSLAAFIQNNRNRDA